MYLGNMLDLLEYTEILEKKKDCLIPKQQIKIIPEVNLSILLLLCC